MSIRALIFAAVSTEAQATPDKVSLDQQVNECRVAIQRNGWVEVGVVRVEGQSRDYLLLGELMGESSEYNRLVNMIRQRAMHVVVCAAYDRLWRTDAIRAQLAAVARESDVRLYSVAQPIPLDSDEAAYWMEMLSGASSEMENRERVRKHRRGMTGRVAQKGLHPMGEPPYGYARADSTDDPLVQVPEEIPWARLMFERLLSGHTLGQICAELHDSGVRTRRNGLWWKSTIRDILSNPVYAGGIRYRHYKWSKERKPGSKKHRCLGLLSEEIYWTGQHEPVISRADWERAQRILAGHVNGRKHSHFGPWALSGILRCGYCEAAMTRKNAHNRTPRVRCSRYAGSGGRLCQNNEHVLAAVEADVLAQVKEALHDPAAFAAALVDSANNGHRTELEALRNQRADLANRMENIYTAIESGRFDLSKLADQYDTLQMHYQEVDQRIINLETQTDQVNQFVQLAINLASVVEELDEYGPEGLGRVYRQLIKAVYVRRKEPVEIRWLLG